jgi:cobalt-zinc-cadmium efflux system protein
MQGHSHSAAGTHAGRLTLVLVLTAGYTAVEVIGGLLTGSLALIADAGHMLTDALGIAMALVAIKLASRPATSSNTYGFYRLEIFAALLNGLLLFGVGAYVLYEAYNRFSDPPDITGLPVMAIAAVGLAINLGSAYLLMEGQRISLNMRGAFLEVVSDLLGSLAVLVAGVIIALTDFNLIDPIVSIAIGAFVLPRTYRLTREALHILLEGVPRHIDMDVVRKHILDVDGVTSVHDLHVWSISSGVDLVSAHVVVDENAVPRQVLDELCACLGEHFDIEHSTFQIERTDRSAIEHASH